MRVLESEQAVRLEPAQPARAAVIWLHGLGADGHDFVPIVPELNLPPELAVRFVFPHAPVRPVTINGGMRMRAWYDIYSLTRGDRQDEAGIRASAAIAQGFIEEQVSAGIARNRIVLAGFSQGGAIALHTGLRQTAALAGILALSTYLPIHDRLPAELTAAGRATPILMCHGLYDPVLPLQLGADTRDGLRGFGCHVEWRDYPMQHQVCAEEIADISVWLRARLAG
ncbi:MAG: carboxylesterase [Sinobacteraceae bacterium]|nr:carboxylesterase [Nevskiaceae bacterium]